MAEKVEIDIPGIGLIEAKNASTEATLLEILETLKASQKIASQQQKNQGKTSTQGGGGGAAAGAAAGAGMNAAAKSSNQAAKGLGTMAQAGQLAGKSFKLMGFAAGATTQTLSGLSTGAQVAAGATVAFGGKLLDAGQYLTDFMSMMASVGDSTQNAARALSVIPGVGGILAGVFGTIAGAVEGAVGSFQKAAAVGATFGGSVDAMSRAAGGAGMTLDQFAGLIAANSESMMLLGGTTEQGAKQFANLAKDIQSSGVGSELQRLGYTTEQINGGMAKYINILGKTGALQGMSTQQIAASSGAYLKELDALAKITGVSREEKEKEQSALMADAKVRAAMSGLDAEQQKQMMAYITSFPKEQQAAIADMIATGNTTTEEAIKLQSMLPGVAQRTMEFGRTIQAGGRINQDSLNQAKNSAILEAKEAVKRDKARAMYDEEFNKTYVGGANLAAQKVDGYSQAIGEQAKATEKANLAENLTKAKQRLAEFSNSFQMALANSGMFDSLMKSFEALAGFTTSVILPLFNVFSQAISAITPVLVSILVPAFKTLGEFIGNTVVPAFEILGNWMQTAVIPIFEQAYEIVSSVVGSLFNFLDVADAGTEGLGIFEEVLYTISDFIEDNLQAVLIGFGVIMGTVLVGKVMAFGAAMLTTLMPIGSFVLGVVTATAKLAFMAVKVALAAASFLAINFPILSIIAVLGTLAFVGKKLGVDFKVLGDAASFIGSLIKSVFLGAMKGVLSLLNKIPGMRGDFNEAIQGVDESLAKESEKRNQLTDDMGKRMSDNRAADKAAEEKAAAEKAANEKAALGDQTEEQTKAAKRQEEREARKAKREQDAIDRKKRAELDAVGAKEKREKDAEDAKKEAEQGPTVDMSSPIQMLKTFSAQQKSAFTQEAKALDDKEKARSEMKMASDEYSKAMEARNKAMASGSAEEKKAAEARLVEAEKRNKAAQERQTKTQEAVDEAKKRMDLAKAGKDPGPTKVAEGKPGGEAPTGAAAAAGARAQGTVPAINQDVQKNLELVKAALQKQGLNDPKYIAATLGNVMKETGGKSISENMDYSNTSNERIKKIFGSRAAGKTDQELDTIKKDPTKMGEMMYGKDTKMGQQMGNTEAGDGWKYRGRGFIQLTGKSNYAAASKAIYGDNRLVDNPDLVNDPAVAAEVSAWYMKKGQARMASGLGIDTKNMTQDQANLLATSQIAGGDIRKKGAIGQELSGKVDKFASSGQIQAIAGAPGGPATATATPTGVDAGGRGPGMKDDPRLAKPATTTPTAATTPAAGEVQTPQFAMQILIKDGIIPTTIAFQDLVKKGIMPMLTGVVAAEKRGPDRILAGAETPKTEIIAQKEKEAQEKIELERQQAANREQLRKEEIMAMNGPAGQNSPGGEATDLNTALRELIAINKRTADLNEKQLSVQSGLSGDLFA
jgi:predicted chitinase